MNQNRTAQTGYAFLYRVGYVVALALIVMPLSDIMLGILPMQFGSMRWRVGATGLFTGAALLPICGLLLALTISHVRSQRLMQYFLATCAGIAGLALLAIVGFFVLDTLQLRNDVNPQRTKLYDRATIKGVISQLLLVVSLIWMCLGSLRASLAARRTERARAKSQERVVMRAGEVRPPTPSASALQE